MKLLKKIRHSLSLRLLLMFLVAGLVLSLLFQGMLGLAIGHHVRHQIAPHLLQYVTYIQQDIGHPPNQQRAAQLAAALPVEIMLQPAGAAQSPLWQSGPIPDRILSAPLQQTFTTPQGQSIAFNFEHEGVLLRYQQDQQDVIIWGKGWQRPDHRRGGLLFGVAVLLAALALLYYLIQRMLRPLQTVRSGVQQIGSGNLAHRITPARQDELGELAVSINHMADDIAQMLDSKRELLLAISHELRSPLTRAQVSLALLDPSSTQANIARDLHEMESMISELLEAERLSGRHASLNRSPAHINDIATQVVREFFPTARVQLTLADDLPSQSLDTTRLRLVVRNVLDNALKHQPQQAEPVQLHTRRINDSVELTVRDHGSGIAAEHLAHLTEPFYRADASRQRQTGGFGLGLYLVKLIIEAHQGALTIHSEPGVGTTVVISLPFHTDSDLRG